MTDATAPALSRQSSFKPADESDAQTACMAFSCRARGVVADALRANRESWNGTSWLRKYELLQEEQRREQSQGLNRSSSMRRMAGLGRLALGLYVKAPFLQCIIVTFQ
jgi:hypothetical protein